MWTEIPGPTSCIKSRCGINNGHDSVPLSRLHRTTKQLYRLAGRFGRCRSSQAIIVLRGLTAAV